MSEMSQQQRIENWLLEGNRITQQIAIERFGCYRLASVIHRLSRRIKIETKYHEITVAGHKTRYSEHWIDL